MRPILIMPLLASLFATTSQAETCADFPATELVDHMRICVSSVLPPQVGNSYGPANLFDGSGNAWCEGAPGFGIGETVTLSLQGAGAFRQVMISNGYAKSDKAFFANGRVRLAEISTDLAAPVLVELPDTAAPITITLPGNQPDNHRVIRFRIVDVYPGSKYRDTCLSLFAADLEHERDLEWKSQGY
ncbi:hypothetical protein FDP25_13945 [Roseovarius sp. A21]|uniref:NAD glycohydrolase translocation F5/8 type C domain-containing protein n=1 Tax=Roseovarius bejariae TaxID=2576383 RepID=A0A844D135_9RHOB|nr:hypothetical protein [Roseovarius bejariae]MRU16540.1 hypothetical protein [Roseovarius bejariae]